MLFLSGLWNHYVVLMICNLCLVLVRGIVAANARLVKGESFFLMAR